MEAYGFQLVFSLSKPIGRFLLRLIDHLPVLGIEIQNGGKIGQFNGTKHLECQMVHPGFLLGPLSFIGLETLGKAVKTDNMHEFVGKDVNHERQEFQLAFPVESAKYIMVLDTDAEKIAFPQTNGGAWPAVSKYLREDFIGDLAGSKLLKCANIITILLPIGDGQMKMIADKVLRYGDGLINQLQLI